MRISKKAVVWTVVALALGGCGLRLAGQPFAGRQKLERYAESRYLLALDYMKQSRYELASQQFAIAADSAVSPELKIMAINGRDKAKRIIAEQR